MKSVKMFNNNITYTEDILNNTKKYIFTNIIKPLHRNKLTNKYVNWLFVIGIHVFKENHIVIHFSYHQYAKFFENSIQNSSIPHFKFFALATFIGYIANYYNIYFVLKPTFFTSFQSSENYYKFVIQLSVPKQIPNSIYK